MSDGDQIIKSALHGVGLGSAGIDRIRFGKGVVGKLTTAQMGLYVVCIATIIAGVWLRQPLMSYLGLGGAVGTFLITMAASMIFAAKNPGVALLEGAELVRYTQIEMAAKGMEIPTEQANIAPPQIWSGEQ